MDHVSALQLATVLAVLATIHAAHMHVRREIPCQTSADCPLESCCRQQDGQLITLSGTFDTVGPFLDNHNGTCVPHQAQHGEHCGDFCDCDIYQDLICFRHMSDYEFAPSICEDQSYVEQETRTWLSCYSDPDCKLPM